MTLKTSLTKVNFYGDWLGVGLALKAVPAMIASSADWGMRKYSEKLVKVVKAHINNQDLGWPQLSESTNSGDPRILVNSEDYYNSIKSWRANYRYYAGVKLNEYNSRGIRIVDYAIAHEFGHGNMPKRALWEPSIKEMGGAKGAKDMVSKAIFAKIALLKLKGFNVKYRV